MIEPLITTIIPTFRRPVLLKRAVQSVLDQTYPNFKVAIFDNASNDETKEVVLELLKQDSRIVYHKHPENIGAVANFIFGYEQVQTPYFNFLSDDDFLLPTFFENTLSSIQRYPDAAFCAASSVHINHRSVVQKVDFSKRQAVEYYGVEEAPFEIFKGDFPPWTSILFNKSCTESVGGPDPHTVLFDADLIIRLAMAYPICIINTKGAVFYDHADSFSRRSGLPSYALGFERFLNRIMQFDKADESVRVSIKNMYQNEFANYIYLQSIRHLLNHEIEIVKFGAGLLNDQFNEKVKALKLLRLAKLCSTISGLSMILSFLNSFRRMLKNFYYKFSNFFKYRNVRL